MKCIKQIVCCYIETYYINHVVKSSERLIYSICNTFQFVLREREYQTISILIANMNIIS